MLSSQTPLMLHKRVVNVMFISTEQLTTAA